MSAERRITGALEDVKVNVKIRLAALWATLLLMIPSLMAFLSIILKAAVRWPKQGA
jgi:hypothetical protein